MTAGRPACHVPECEADAIARVTSLSPHYASTLEELEATIRPEHFHGAANRAAWEAASDIASSGKRPTMQAVSAWLRERQRLGGDVEAHLRGLRPGLTGLSNDELGKRLVNAWRMRELGWRLQETMARCYTEPCDNVEDVLAAAADHVDTLSRVEAHNSDRSIRDAARAAFSKFETFGDKPKTAPSGLRDLDAITGGLRDTDLVIVAGRPSMGKSSLAMQMALATAEVDPTNGVYVVSLEMPDDLLTQRLICTRARVDARALERGQVTPDDWSKMTEAAAHVGGLNVVFAHERGMTPALVRARVKRRASAFAKDGKRLRLVIVDYLGLMNCTGIAGKNGRTDQELGKAVKVMKDIACVHQCPVVLVAQLNRATEKQARRPIMSDLRDSGEIEQDADTVIFVHRPEHYLRESTTEKDKGIAEIVVAKQRNGATGVVRTRWFGQHTLFADLEPSDDRWINPDDL